MSEQVSGAPKTPEQPNTPENEKIGNERVALATRLLLGEAALNPTKKDFQEIKPEQLNKLDESVRRIQSLSRNERNDYWQKQPEKDFEKQKLAWAEQVKASLNKKMANAQGEQKSALESTYKRFGIDGEITNDVLLGMYEHFFSGDKNESNVGNFVTMILHSYEKDKKVDHVALRKDMQFITWFSNIFGENTAKIMPSLIEAGLSNIDKDAKDELVIKANKKDANSTYRVNNPTAEENKLLTVLFGTEAPVTKTTPALKEDTKEKEKEKRAEVVPASAITKINESDSGFPDDDKRPISNKNLARIFINPDTGEAFDTNGDIEDFSSYYNDIVTEVKKKIVQAKGKETPSMPKNRPTFIMSNALLSQIDQIASKANEGDGKELGFGILGITLRKDGQDIMVGATVVPNNDYRTAKKESHTLDASVYNTNKEKIIARTNLKESLADKDNVRENNLIMVHIHHTKLDGRNIDTPSPQDIVGVENELKTNPRVVWGIATKMPTGDLHMSFYECTKIDGKITWKLINIEYPDKIH